MRATFPFQSANVVLDNGQCVDLRVYTGTVLGAESSSATHVSGVVANGRGSISSQTVSTGQLWLAADNGAKKSFVLADGLPFTPGVGHRISVMTGFAAGRLDKELNLAVHGHEYDATYWLPGEDFERTLTRTGLMSQAWGLMMVVYAALIVTIIGIPVALLIGMWTGSKRRRTFRDLRAKALATFDATTAQAASETSSSAP